jgi:predicted RNA-binding Zn-ribbon protein involved in translation (DUF1610 family)
MCDLHDKFDDMPEAEKEVLFELQANNELPICMNCLRLMIQGNHASHICFACPECGRTDGCSGEDSKDFRVPTIIDDRLV